MNNNIQTYLVDTTLRDGEQSPGVVFLKEDKIDIALKLDKLGIEELETGTPAMGENEIKDMKLISGLGCRFKTIAWCRAIEEDIINAEKTGVDAVNISFPVSALHLALMGKDCDWSIKKLSQLIPFAKKRFQKVYIGAQDASRADSIFLNQFLNIAVCEGADRIRIADTVGIMTPLKVARLFRSLREEFPDTDFEFHPHNDLGMATANALTALEMGANGVSCTVNGLGERAGNAALEEVIISGVQSELRFGNYHLTHIDSLSKLVSQRSNVPVASSKPIVGSNAFVHESGIHARFIIKNKLSYQPFNEQIIGRGNRIVFGKHSGKAGLERFFSQKGINLNTLQLLMVMRGLKDIAIKTRSVISENQIMQLYDKLFTTQT